MKKKALLKQIEQLHKQLVEVEFRVHLLEKKESNRQVVSIPSVWSLQDTCQHEYPESWNSTAPFTCKRCGKIAPAP